MTDNVGDDPNVRAYAIHESGHAVAAVHFGFTVTSVSVTMIRTFLDGKTEIPYPQERDRAEGGVKARAVVAVAGIAAMRRFQRASDLDWPAPLNSDRIEVRQFLQQAGLEGVALDEAVAEAEEEADRLMADPERWREVEALADELLATEAVTFALAGPKATAFVRNKSRPPQGLPRAK